MRNHETLISGADLCELKGSCAIQVHRARGAALAQKLQNVTPSHLRNQTNFWESGK